ncbi:hypothetical protein AVEN_170931-1 [Araneus ventricosus]|uniref:Histone-lysine N-methyltransferase SETMAR n=1 Tax=Araneus ventricosus TaxID=182803 RepID=A0A4Y2LAB0_ARAVE|nr:hypothetical protein AVEN_170931-1 [Araneus ventricosus]
MQFEENIQSRRIFFHYDNAQPHTARLTQRKTEEFRWQILKHPLYSPDLAPSDYHLFGLLKFRQVMKHFAAGADVKREAFADDLALVLAGRVRKELENKTNKALDAIANKLRELKLDLSVDKCQGLAFRFNVHYRQRRGPSIFNRNPIFKINGQSVKIGNSLKFL